MSHTSPNQVVLVDDHSAVRAGYRLLLESDPALTVVAEYSSGEEANQHITGIDADIVVMDLSMPGMGGVEAIRRLKIKKPDLKFLVFTMHENATFLTHAMKAGASGYITKSGAANNLHDAVHAILGGGQYIDPSLSDAMPSGKHSSSEAGVLAKLSRREFQIFCKFAEGLSTTEIADELSLSMKTVANYQTQIKDKLQLHTSAEWVKLAINNGIIQV